MPFFEVRKKFEGKGGRHFNELVGISGLHVKANEKEYTKGIKTVSEHQKGGLTYHSIIDPHSYEHIVKILLEESKVKTPDEALPVLLKFAEHAAKNKDSVAQKRDPAENTLLHSQRTLLFGEGQCKDIGSMVAGLTKAAGLPTRMKKQHGKSEAHYYTEVWTPDSGWVHIGYKERILAPPETPAFQEWMKHIEREEDPNKRLKYLDALRNGLARYQIPNAEGALDALVHVVRHTRKEIRELKTLE